MTDVIELIENHHREIEDLFAKFESTHDAAVAFQLCDELDRHAIAEEKVIYPVIVAEVPGGREITVEHHVDEEETEVLPLTRAALEPARLEQLGSDFVAAMG